MHGPSTEWKRDNATSIKELLGIWLFIMYLIVYTAFIILNIVSPRFMSTDIGSLNVAIAYGMGLIILAMILAFAYNHVSTHAEEILNHKDERDEETA